MKKILLLLGFFTIFITLGILALKDGMPSQKNERVYQILQEHMPYTLEKRVGGYSIVSKVTGIKEKPPAKDLFLRLEQLEKMWGKEFLKLENSNLIVFSKDEKKKIVIQLRNKDEINWVKNYFQLK